MTTRPTCGPLRLAALALFGLAFSAPAYAIIIINGADQFPVLNGIYSSQNGTGPVTVPGPGSTPIDVEIVSLQLVGLGPSVLLPPPGPVPADSFFDVFVELNVDGVHQVDSFFDVFFEIDIMPGSPGTVDTEIVQMQLTGNVGGIPIMIRESPTQQSAGQHVVTPLGPGPEFQVDSFFDIFFEITIDNGQTFHTLPPLRVNLVGVSVPEPASLALVLLGLGAAGVRRRAARPPAAV
jgi:hypothetical protein